MVHVEASLVLVGGLSPADGAFVVLFFQHSDVLFRGNTISSLEVLLSTLLRAVIPSVVADFT
jgi:hypothetical protein